MQRHPYSSLATALREADSAARILGLTASLTYAFERAKMKRAIETLLRDLRCTQVATASPDELERDGYTGAGTRTDVLPVDDVDGHICMATGVAGVIPESMRRPHEMIGLFWKRVSDGSATLFALRLVAVVRAFEHQCGLNLTLAAPPVGVSEWSNIARKAAVTPFTQALVFWYDALRILIVSWEESWDIAATLARMQPVRDSQPPEWPVALLEPLAAFWAEVPTTNEFPRFRHLEHVLIDKLEEYGDLELRVVLFVEQRLTTAVLEHVIHNSAALGSRLRGTCLISTRKSGGMRMTKAQADAAVSKFRAGDVNVLLATNVAEEGMDIAAANCVIRFDAVMTQVSLVQGKGRARADASCMAVMRQRPDRTVAMLQERAQLQLEVVGRFTAVARSAASGVADSGTGTAAPSPASPVSRLPTSPTSHSPCCSHNPDSAMRDAVDRERMALSKMGAQMRAPGSSGKDVMMVLNEFCQMTQVELKTTFEPEAARVGGSPVWRARLLYVSHVPRRVEVFGRAPNKADAKRAAATDVLRQLCGNAA